MKLGKAILLVLMENAFCIMFLVMITDTLFSDMNWGIPTMLIIGMFWLVSFSLCAVGLSDHVKKQDNDKL